MINANSFLYLSATARRLIGDVDLHLHALCTFAQDGRRVVSIYTWEIAHGTA